MDYPLLFIAGIILLGTIIFLLRIPGYTKWKGSLGEYRISKKLKKLKTNEYIVLNDIFLKVGDFTTQIDHIVIGKTGIFIIETKYLKGWIHGGENAEYWTQTIYNHRTRIGNPIRQNRAHIYAIKKALPEFRRIKFHPIVVLVGNGKLKNVVSTQPVIYEKQLLKTIKSHSEEILSFSEIKTIADKLQAINITDRKEKRVHNKRIKNKLRERKRKLKLKICPRCNAKLIKKKGKYGKFYGCSNFPDCRFTIKKIR